MSVSGAVYEIVKLLGKGKGGYSYLAGRINYFLTNCVVCGDEIFYIDYECNYCMGEWDFENWGIKYWSKTPEFTQYA